MLRLHIYIVVMKMLKAKVMKIGDSFGIIMPKEVLDLDNIKVGDEIVIKGIEKARIEDMFGIWKGLPSFTHVPEDHELQDYR